jgi:hypothetical protein
MCLIILYFYNNNIISISNNSTEGYKAPRPIYIAREAIVGNTDLEKLLALPI